MAELTVSKTSEGPLGREYWERLRVVTLGPQWTDILAGAEDIGNFRKEALDAEGGVRLTQRALSQRSS